MIQKNRMYRFHFLECSTWSDSPPILGWWWWWCWWVLRSSSWSDRPDLCPASCNPNTACSRERISRKPPPPGRLPSPGPTPAISTHCTVGPPFLVHYLCSPLPRPPSPAHLGAGPACRPPGRLRRRSTDRDWWSFASRCGRIQSRELGRRSWGATWKERGAIRKPRVRLDLTFHRQEWRLP